MSTSPEPQTVTSIRFRPDVRARLDAWCAEHQRSVNWATNRFVDQALDAEGWPPADSTQTDNPTGMEP